MNGKNNKDSKKVILPQEKISFADRILPLADRVLVKPLVEDELVKRSSFGIILPETISKEKPEQGFVLAVGEGKIVDGKMETVRVSVGDRIVFSKYGYDEIKIGDEELYIIKEENILAIIKNK